MKNFAIKLRRKFVIGAVWLVVMVASISGKSQEINGEKKSSSDSSVATRQIGDFHNREEPNWQRIWEGLASDFYTQAWQLAVCQAIADQDQDKLVELLKSKEHDINAIGKDGMTFVCWAYLQGNLEAYKYLLLNAASPDVAITTELNMLSTLTRTKDQSVLLHAYPNRLKRPEFFEAGIGYTKEPNQRFSNGDTLAHFCAKNAMSKSDLSLLMKIIATGVDLNAKNERGETACHVAINHNPDGLLILILAGADPKIPFPDGRELVDEVRKRCNPTVNPLSVHYEVVDYWLELLLAPPKFQRAPPK